MFNTMSVGGMRGTLLCAMREHDAAIGNFIWLAAGGSASSQGGLGGSKGVVMGGGVE